MGNTDSSLPPPPPPPPPVATITSGANTSTPTIVLNSVGTFNIVATVSSSQNYTGTTLTSLPITVHDDIPDIEFSLIVTAQSPYTYQNVNSIEITGGAASITNNTGQTIIYSIVTADSTTTSLTPSTIATIDPTGWFLDTISCGTFRICATVDVSGNFGPNVAFSDVLTIQKATPTILLPYPQINLNITPPVTSSTLVFGQIYTIIPDPSQISTITSNTDTSPAPNINYVSSDSTIAKVYGTTVTIVGIGNFHIMINVSQTTNYNQIYRYPLPQIYETIQAVPTININSFPPIPQILGYGSPPYVIPSTIKTSNTDIPGPVISYASSDNNIAKISGNTINVTGVVNGTGIGNYQILVTISATTNFSSVTYTYPSPTTSYSTEWSTPKITFPPTFVYSSVYGSTYNFVAPILSNNDPSQTLTYSIINSNPVVPSTTSVATLVPNPQSPTANPSVVINSVGTFQIQASCQVSTNGYYSAILPGTPGSYSNVITIANEIPIIAFNTSNFNSSATTLSPICNWTDISVSSNGQYQSAVEYSGSIYTSSTYGSIWNKNTSAPTSANWNSVSLSSTGQYQSAVVNGGSIYTSSDSGQTWTANTSAPVNLNLNWDSVSISSTGQYQTAIVSGGSIYTSSDSGQTWTANTSAPTSVNWDSVSISSTGQYQTAVVSGGSIYTSLDYGQTWTQNTSAPTGVKWNSVSISSASGLYQSAVVNGGSIYTSSDIGQTWNPNTSAPTGVNWNSISLSSTGQYQSAVINGGSIYTSLDYGQTWTQVTSVLPLPSALWVSISISSSGQYQNVCVTNGNIYFSSDYGITWSTDASVSYIYTTTPYTFASSNTLAYITNNTVQSLTYSIVATDGITPSTVATISSDGTSLTTNSIGSFQILATATATSNGDYGGASLASEIIQILSATPSITPNISVPQEWIYGCTYSIPYPNNGNTDTSPAPVISYSTYSPGIISISGTNITIIGVGDFQIIFTVGGTANYNSNTCTYPSPTQSYTSIQANPTITYPSNFGSGWVLGGIYDLTTTVTTNAGSGYTDSNQVFYTIINESISNNASMYSSSSVIINDVGTFQIQADLPATNYFTAAPSLQSNIITIYPSNVTITYNNFSNFVYGQTYTLSVNITNTDTNPPPNISYVIFPQSGSTGNGNINGTSFTPTSCGGAYIYVNISQTENFNPASIPIYVNIAQAIPNVVMNTGWINDYLYNLTIGSVFPAEALISSNSNTDPGVSYSLSYTIVNGINTVSLPNSSTVYCNAPGLFWLEVTSNATANFQAYAFNTPVFYVSVVPEVIIFNNPQTYPPDASVSGEVGMAICITQDSYPFGFNNYSALTITNVSQNGATFTLDNTTTTPTFSSVIANYMVFVEPATAGSFLGGLANTTAISNIAYLAVDPIASGMSSGQNLTFTFSGNTVGGNAPDPFVINWNPGSLDLSQGLVYSAFYVLANNIYTYENLPNGNGVQVSTLNSGGITGYYIAPWAGFDTNSVTGGVPILNQQGYSDIQQAWGVWLNPNYGNIYGPTSTQDGVNYYYVGIPQMAMPLTYYP